MLLVCCGFYAICNPNNFGILEQEKDAKIIKTMDKRSQQSNCLEWKMICVGMASHIKM